MLALCVVASLIVSSCFGLTSPLLARGLSPRTATWLISIVAALTSAISALVVAILAFTFLAQLPLLATIGEWSTSTFDKDNPTPVVLGLTACLVTASIVVRAGTAVAEIGGDLWQAALACWRAFPADDHLTVREDTHPDAYALPGLWGGRPGALGGRIVVTTAMLAALDEAERKVLIAHEASHLQHRHHLYVALAELAGAVHPSMRAVPRVVREAAERWADEDAAKATGDRRLTARAVARAGLESARVPLAPRAAGATRESLVLAISGSQVTRRAQSLLRPALRNRPIPLIVAAVVLGLSMSAAVVVTHTTAQRFEAAHTAYESV